MSDINTVMENLSKKRPIFHSEADFQHALAWEIHKQLPESAIRLERRYSKGNKRIYFDIWIDYKGETIIIELKYKTKEVSVEIDNEKFNLRNHGAWDLGRYDFIKDISRLEKIVLSNKNKTGYAIFLTNDNSYWEDPLKEPETIDRNFRIHSGKDIKGNLKWVGGSPGTIKNRNSIKIRGNYKIDWNGYSKQKVNQYGLFKYVVIPVGRRIL